MTPVFNPQIDTGPNWREAFPRLRTLPGGWDLTALADHAEADRQDGCDLAVRSSNRMNLPVESFFDRWARTRGLAA